MQDRGDLVQDAQGRWIAGPTLNWDLLPARIEGVIAERADRLAGESKAILLVASVEGDEFTAQVVARVENLSERSVLRQLGQELEQQHRLVCCQGDAPVGLRTLTRFRFAHGLFQQHFYRLLGPERRALHGAVGAVLEELYADQAEAIALPLARHFEAAGRWDKAAAYFLRAGDQARRLYACADAIGHFERALQCAAQAPAAGRPAPELRAHQALGELLTITGQYVAAREHLHLARGLATAAGDVAAAAHICRWLARSYENEGDYAPALEWVQTGLAALAGRETAETVQLQLIAGLVHLRRGELDQALGQAQAALQLAQTLGEPHALARTYLLLAVIALQRGENRRSVELAQRGLALYVQAGDLAGQATAHNQVANALFNMGDWSGADRAYRQAQAAFTRMGDLYNRAFVENNLGEIALNQGRLDEALAFYQAALRATQEIGGSVYVVGVLHNNLGAVCIRQGDLAAAREHLRECLACFAQARSRDILPEVHRHLAEIARQEGDAAQAEAEGQRSLALARELQAQNEAAITQRLLGELALARSDVPTAAAYLGESLVTLHELGETCQAARTRLALARLAQAIGRPAEARAELDRCEPVFARLGAAPDLAAARALRAALPP